MQISQHCWQQGHITPALPDNTPQLVLIFGNQAAQQALPQLQQQYPEAIIAGCSTGGEIIDSSVCDDQVSISLLSFRHTRVQAFTAAVDSPQRSYYVAQELAAGIDTRQLRHLLVFCNGIQVNAQEVVSGINSILAPFNSISGGVAGDGDRFQQTCTYFNDGSHHQRIILIAFYGQQLQVQCGSYGGWDTFGPMRRVTRSRGTRLYELDGQSALALYERYLGDFATDLPGSALRFPLEVQRHEQDNNPVVCSVFGIDRDDGCLIFSQDIPEGSITRLMRANLDRLIDGAQTASEQACRNATSLRPEFALLISCVGRRTVLQQLVDEELETLSETLQRDIPHAGFYSYGEIAPNMGLGPCNLHNQTMTITTFAEQD